MPGYLTELLDDTFYPDASRAWDDERFAEVIREHLQPTFHILDFGAGRGKADVLDFRKSVERIVGVDVDDEVLENPLLDEKHVIAPNQPLAFDSNSFDLVYSCNVLEHLTDPHLVFAEIERVLKPGGIFLSKTTNKNHYIACVARSTPQWFHERFNQWRGRNVKDTFPTVYKCNSPRQVRRIASSCGLRIEALEFWEWRPEYLRISPFTYMGGILYEKCVNSTKVLAPFRAVMLVDLRKGD
jgi:ubiquinone/menaquinone biosynthesis C-methylase UbiE